MTSIREDIAVSAEAFLEQYRLYLDEFKHPALPRQWLEQALEHIDELLDELSEAAALDAEASGDVTFETPDWAEDEIDEDFPAPHASLAN